jgi:hypothetical protein
VVTAAVAAIVMAEAAVGAATMEVVAAITGAAITAVAIITAATGEAAAATGAVAGAIRTTTTDRSRITMAMALSTPIRPFRASPSSLDFDSVAPPDCSVQFEFRTLLARALLSILEHETWRHA